MNARAIKDNPNILESEIITLKTHQNELQSRLSRYNNLKESSLDLFAQIAKDNNLKLTGIDEKNSRILQSETKKEYDLILSGRITSALNALDYIENNVLVSINGIRIMQDKNNEKLVNMPLRLSFPNGSL
jgi:hypothetical protein